MSYGSGSGSGWGSGWGFQSKLPTSNPQAMLQASRDGSQATWDASAQSRRGSVAAFKKLQHSASESFRIYGITSLNLARIVLSIYFTLHNKKSLKDMTETGKFRNKLPTSLWKELKKDNGLILDKIHYCQVMLNQWFKSTLELSEYIAKEEALKSSSQVLDVNAIQIVSDEVKDLINHDFLVLEFHRGDSQATKLFIKAEKVGGPSAGILVDEHRALDDDFYEHVKPYTIDCKGKAVGNIKSIMEILEKENPDYHVTDANCWAYARNTTRLLLNECIQRTDVSARDERQRLETERDELCTNLRRKQIIDLSQDVKNKLKKLLRL